MLTRFIKPNQPLPDNNKKHRSDVVLVERDTNSQGQVIFRFRYEAETNPDAPLLYTNARWVALTEEGHHLDLFDGPGEPREDFEEPKTKWGNSMARKMLYDDIANEIVRFDEENMPLMTLEDIYSMNPEYSKYSFERFEERLLSLHEIFLESKSRAREDYAALELHLAQHPISFLTFQGMIQWQGSDAQKLAEEDVDNDLQIKLGYRGLYNKRPEYYDEFLFDVFKDKVRQVVRTKKYVEYITIKRKQNVRQLGS